MPISSAPGIATGAGGTVKLTWKPPGGAPASASVKYHVDRASAHEPWKAEFSRFATVAATNFADLNLDPSQVYSYRVQAVVDGEAGPSSLRVRTQPRVAIQPVVSVLAGDHVAIAWNRHPDADVVGYNLYRGLAKMKSVKKGTPTAWRDNDPEYDQPLPVQVRDIVDLQKLNDRPLTDTRYVDRVHLTRSGTRRPDGSTLAVAPESDEYKFAVYAYVVRAINKLGTESGPSPYALTIPSEPLNVLCREQGEVAEFKWDANREEGIVGYHVYKLKGTWEIVRVTEEPLKATTFRHAAGKNTTRYWIVAVDELGQEGQPSTPAWFNQSHRGFFTGDWHQ